MMASDVPASVSAPAAFTAPSATIALPGQAASLTAPDGRVVVDLESLRISPAEGTRYRLTMGRRGSARRVTVATFGRWAELGWAPRGHSFFLTQGLASDRSDCLVVAPRRGRMSTLSLTSVVRGQPGPLTAAERPSTSHFYLEGDHWAHVLHNCMTVVYLPDPLEEESTAPGATSMASAYTDQRGRMPVSWADPGPGLNGRGQHKQRLAMRGIERAAADAAKEAVTTPARNPAATPQRALGSSSAPSSADFPLSFEVSPPFELDVIGSTASGQVGATAMVSSSLSALIAPSNSPLPQPRTVGQYLAGLRQFQRLRYLAQPADSPALCLGIPGGDGLIHTDIRVMVDDGSDINLITEATCVRLGIPICPTNICLTTSNGQTAVAGVTPPLPITYGVGGGPLASLTTHHCLLVVRDMDHVFEVLLGNVDTQRFGGTIDSLSHTYTLHLSYPDDEIKVSLPTTYAAPRRLRSVRGAQ